MKNIIFIFGLFLLVSCQQNSEVEVQLVNLATDLATAKQEIAALKKQEVFPLHHLVYLNVKNDIRASDLSKLLAAIDKLEDIPKVNNLKKGQFKNLNDSRALSQFEVFFQMDFKDSLDYQVYQSHDIHHSLKELAKGLLEAPPVTYDFVTDK